MACWFLAGFAGRGLLATHIEGILDHDQAVVGLMALDISQARRFPVFFDGQRYMGAIEAYLAAGFVRLFGFSPHSVTLAPLLFCGLFVMGQYALWRHWRCVATGHLAALFTLCCSPMVAVWTMIPRGGYVELLCWALPVLAFYRRFTRPHAPQPSRGVQFAWGLLLGLGYFINPLSIVVYGTLFADWVFGRHGADVRRARRLDDRRLWRILEKPWSLAAWAVGLVFSYLLLTFGCHVRLAEGADFVFANGLFPPPYSMILGIGVVAFVFVWLFFWTGSGIRAVALLTSHQAFAIGLSASLVPFAIFHFRSRLGLEPPHSSLPMWLRDPLALGQNVHDLLCSLGPLLGCDERGVALMYDRWPEQLPLGRMPVLSAALSVLSIPMVLLIACLVGRVVVSDREQWARWLALRSDRSSTPTMLAALGVIMVTGLYLVQATSPDGSSTRYLVPLSIFLPGLLASAIDGLRRLRLFIVSFMVGSWVCAQAVLWRDTGQPNPCRPVTAEIERLGARAIIAPQHIGLLVAELSGGRVGLYEYQPFWMRVHDRYRKCFLSGQTIVCVAEVPNRGLPQEDLGGRMRVLSRDHGLRVRMIANLPGFEIWSANLPLELICEPTSHVHAKY